MQQVWNEQSIELEKEVLSVQQYLQKTFIIEEDGWYRHEIKIKTPTDWEEKGNEALLLRLYLNDDWLHDLVLHGNGQDDAGTYSSFIGELTQGEYTLTITLSNPTVETNEIVILNNRFVRLIPEDKIDTLAYRFAPILYGRNLYNPYDNLTTDVPLLCIYRGTYNDHGYTVLEYQMVFSHEDEGTPAPFLMSKWGRLLDIEWMVVIYLNEEDEFLYAEYQGAEHETKTFAGCFYQNNRPVLQTATANGNFKDEITSSYRFALEPLFNWDRKSEPREAVMLYYPFINQVMIKEARRQITMHHKANITHVALSDPTSYVYFHAQYEDREHQNETPDIRCHFRDGSVTSTTYDDLVTEGFSAASTVLDPYFSTAAQIPGSLTSADLKKITMRVRGKVDNAIASVKSYTLEDSGYLRPLLYVECAGKVSLSLKEIVIWEQ